MWDKIMLRKRYIIECINELLKNKANLVHSRHRSIHNFIMNLCSALTAYCFFDNKPEALPVYVEKSKQLELFAYWTYPELEYFIIRECLPKSLKTIAYNGLNCISKCIQIDYALFVIFKPFMPVDKLIPKHVARQRILHNNNTKITSPNTVYFTLSVGLQRLTRRRLCPHSH